MNEINNFFLFKKKMNFNEPNPLFSNQRGSLKQEAKIKKRYKRRNKDQQKEHIYRSRNPQPNYSSFGTPDLIDTEGREYRSSGNHQLRNEIIALRSQTTKDFGPFDPSHVSLKEEQEWGTQLFWIRIKKGEKDLIYFPEAEHQEITFYDPKHQVLCIGITDGVFHEPQAATGYVVLKSFVSLGQVNDPQNYEYLTDKSIKVHKRVSFL
jgi:hypothetical protein